MSKNEVLIQLILTPHGNYHGPVMFDYKIISKEIANIIKEFLTEFKDTNIQFYNGQDMDCKLNRVKIKIFENAEMIKAFELLMVYNVILPGSFGIYNLIVEKLMHIDKGEDYFYDELCDSNVTQEKISTKWKILHT